MLSLRARIHKKGNRFKVNLEKQDMGDNHDICSFCEYIDVTCFLPQIKRSRWAVQHQISGDSEGGRLKTQFFSPGTFGAISASLIIFGSLGQSANASGEV